MHYHAVHIFFFFPVPYVLLCSLSLSLSLSLLFSLLLMEPKKSVPSKNPIRCDSFSSFPFDFVQFCDEKAPDELFENFFDRVIHSKC